MVSVSKHAALILFAVLALAVVSANHSLAQPVPPLPTYPTTPVLSTPEFNATFVGQPYDVPESYSQDPYTGANVTNHGYHMNNGSILITIKNQKFNSMGTYSIYYEIAVGGHFGGSSVQLFQYLHDYYLDYMLPPSGLLQSDSEYTTYGVSAVSYPPNSQINVEVRALLFNKSQIFVSDHAMLPGYGPGHYETVISLVSMSNSSIQIAIIPGTAPSASPSPSLTTLPTATTTPTAISPAPTQTSSLISATPVSPSSDQPNLNILPYALVAVVAAIIAFAVGLLAAKLRYKKPITT